MTSWQVIKWIHVMQWGHFLLAFTVEILRSNPNTLYTSHLGKEYKYNTNIILVICSFLWLEVIQSN